jgi:hypothetical protein
VAGGLGTGSPCAAESRGSNGEGARVDARTPSLVQVCSIVAFAAVIQTAAMLGAATGGVVSTVTIAADLKPFHTA